MENMHGDVVVIFLSQVIFIFPLACVASVSVRFRRKERGTRPKD